MKISSHGYTLTYTTNEIGYHLEALTGNGVDLTLDLLLPARPKAIAAVLSARGGAATAGVTSKLKAKSSAANGKLGGRPKGSGKKSL